jgi:hypothetical protein
MDEDGLDSKVQLFTSSQEGSGLFFKQDKNKKPTTINENIALKKYIT